MNKALLKKATDIRIRDAVIQEAKDQREWLNERILSGASRIAHLYSDETLAEEDLTAFVYEAITEVLKEIL